MRAGAASAVFADGRVGGVNLMVGAWWNEERDAQSGLGMVMRSGVMTTSQSTDDISGSTQQGYNIIKVESRFSRSRFILICAPCTLYYAHSIRVPRTVGEVLPSCAIA